MVQPGASPHLQCQCPPIRLPPIDAEELPAPRMATFLRLEMTGRGPKRLSVGAAASLCLHSTQLAAEGSCTTDASRRDRPVARNQTLRVVRLSRIITVLSMDAIFVEARAFTQVVEDYFGGDEAYSAFQHFLARSPESGRVMA